MRKQIIEIIEAAVEDASQQAAMVSAWKTPLVGFADAEDPLFGQLKKAVRPSHDLPGDLLPGARTVIAYFLPFDPAIPRSNHRGDFSSEDWAVAYIETNRLIASINEQLNHLLETEGVQGHPPARHPQF
jgi:epoxyqueuosine reductase QueG